ncbi:DUF5719 family protein [Curtobacterium flaccumfaciens]|nr:DUF5719 family protein [Curtobacterium flaccumfaciens]
MTDVPLDDFPDGRYSFTVTSTQPIVTGARTTTPTDGASTGTDLGWFASAEPLGDETITAIAPGEGVRLNFVNPTSEDRTVTVRSGDERRTLTLLSGATGTLSVPTAKQLTLTGTDGVVAGVTYRGADGIAGFPVRPATDVSTPVRVYP